MKNDQGYAIMPKGKDEVFFRIDFAVDGGAGITYTDIPAAVVCDLTIITYEKAIALVEFLKIFDEENEDFEIVDNADLLCGEDNPNDECPKCGDKDNVGRMVDSRYKWANKLICFNCDYKEWKK